MPKRYSQEVLELIDFNYNYNKIYRTGTCHNEDVKKIKINSLKNVRLKLTKIKKMYIFGATA